MHNGESTFSPVQPKSIWISHLLRDFDLMIILQVSGCEHIAARLLRGEPISASNRPPLDIANHVAKQKGYLPLFDMAGREPSISDGGEAVLRAFLDSDYWHGRDPRRTRRL